MINDFLCNILEFVEIQSQGLDSLGLDNPSRIKFEESLKRLYESLDKLEIIFRESGLPPKELSEILEWMRSIQYYDPRKQWVKTKVVEKKV